MSRLREERSCPASFTKFICEISGFPIRCEGIVDAVARFK
jgi:hypothetical protein